MTPPVSVPAMPAPSLEEEVASLVTTLRETERRLEELTGGEVDVVMDREGQFFVLRRAQEQVRLAETTRQTILDRALERQQTELRVLFDLMPALIWVKDTKDVILRVNQRVADLAGKTVEEIEGKPTHNIYPLDAARFYLDDLQVLESKIPRLGLVERLTNPNGQDRWVLTDKVPILDKSGNATGIVIMARDITEQKRSEEALRESNARFGGAFELAPIGMALVSADGQQWLRVNRALCDLLGYTEQEILSQSVADLTHPDDLQISAGYIRRALAGNADSFQLEKRYVHKSGRAIRVAASVSLIHDGRGAPLYYVAHIQDITERTLAEEELRDSDQKFQQLAENITDAFWIRSPDMKEVHFISAAFERIWGRSRESLRAHPQEWMDFVVEEDRERISAEFASLTGDTSSVDVEYRITRPDGDVRWVRGRGFQVLDDDRKLIRIIGIVTDITERCLATARLQASEAEFRILAEAMPQIVWITRPDGGNIYFNPQWFEYTGLTAEQSGGDRWIVPFHPDDRERSWNAWQKATEEIGLYSLEARIRRTDGVYRWWLMRGVPLQGPSGEIVKWLGTCTDIHDMKVAELEILRSNQELVVSTDALRASEREQRQLAAELEIERSRLVAAQRVAKVGNWETDLSTREVSWSDEMRRIFDADTVPPGGEYQAFLRILHPDDRSLVGHAFRHSIQDWRAFPDSDHGAKIEHRLLTPEGRIKFVEERWNVVPDGQGAPARVVGTCQDITERRQSETALQESQERLRDIFNGLGPSVFMALLTPEGILVEVNRSALEAAGVEADDVLDRPFAETVWWAHSSEVQQQLREAIVKAAAGEPSRYDARIRGAGAKAIDIDFSLQPLKDDRGRVVFLISSASVITERKRAEEALRKSQKLEAVGQLAAGVAHEFNNILQTLMSMATITRLRGVSPEITKVAADMEVQIRRGASVTQQLLLAARHQEPVKTSLDLGQEVMTAANLLRRLIPENIAIALEPPREPAGIQGDAGQIQQVILNLAINARDAMPDGGTLTLRVRSIAGEVVLEVEDDGSGFDDVTKERLFEPFFTTKEVGKGTGLGLAVVNGIAEEHGGRIEVRSRLGEGSLFCVIFPAWTYAGALVEPEAKIGFPIGTGTILLVEDEEGVRDGLKLLLEMTGYTVIALARGEEALTLASSTPEPGLLLSDVSLPGIGGPALAARLRERWPALQVTLMTGYVDENTRSTARDEGWDILQKPFEMDELWSHLTKRLSRPVAGGAAMQIPLSAARGAENPYPPGHPAGPFPA